MAKVSDTPPIFHGASIDLDWTEIELFERYQIVEITPDNAEERGYDAGTTGFRVERDLSPVFASLAPSLAEAAQQIIGNIAANLVLIRGDIGPTRCWELAAYQPS